ncbi:MAG TPA: metalloregulator ArsR/SmtB family transcription factor [Candidatus Binataceae bacterium]|nr:metalloregulator ArsR/SmtB family transcription factor [Candidatus Binataceae bacterium]
MEMASAIVSLGALAQESRLEVFRMLVQAGPAGLAAGEIGARLGLPSPTLSFHLNQLRHAGLIAARRQSRSIIYAANYPAMNALLSYLTENCCGGEAAACLPACPPATAPAGKIPAPRPRTRRIARRTSAAAAPARKLPAPGGRASRRG